MFIESSKLLNLPLLHRPILMRYSGHSKIKIFHFCVDNFYAVYSNARIKIKITARKHKYRNLTAEIVISQDQKTRKM